MDFKWTDRVSGVDPASANDINTVAHAVEALNEEIKSLPSGGGGGSGTDIKVPTKTSELENDEGYITLADTVSVYEFADYDNFHLGVLGGYVDRSLLPVGKRVRIKDTNIPLLYVSGQPTSGYGKLPETEQDFITMLNNTGEVSYYGIALRDYAKDSGMVSSGGTGAGLPQVSASDNGKFLRVVNGAWAATTVPNAEEESF